MVKKNSTASSVSSSTSSKAKTADAKVKKPKKVRDENAVKRPTTAFFYWMNENRSKFQVAGQKGSETAKLAGAAWKAMSEAEKTKWNDMAAEDKERYKREK